jgi:hypothetical protein
VEYTRFVRPACLPGNDDVIEPGSYLTVVGWGALGFGEFGRAHLFLAGLSDHVDPFQG